MPEYRTGGLLEPPKVYALIAFFCTIVALWACGWLPYGSRSVSSCVVTCYAINGQSSALSIIPQAATSGDIAQLAAAVLLVVAFCWSFTPWAVLLYGETEHVIEIGVIGFFAQLPALDFGVSWGFLVMLAATLSGVIFAELAAVRFGEERAARELLAEQDNARRQEAEQERWEAEERRLSALREQREAREVAEQRARFRLEAVDHLTKVASRLVEFSKEPIAYPSRSDLEGIASHLRSASDSIHRAGLADLEAVKHPLRELQTQLVRVSREMERSVGTTSIASRGTYVPLRFEGAAISKASFITFSESLNTFARSIGKDPSPGWPTETALNEIRSTVGNLVKSIPSFLVGFNRSLLRDSQSGVGLMSRSIPDKDLGPRRRKYRYDVAISYASEDIRIADAISRLLDASGVRVFFDTAFSSRLWGKDLSDEFQKVFGPQTLFVLVLVSKSYTVKEWTDFEFDIARSEQRNRKEEFILPVRLDNSKMVGLRSTVRFLDVSKEGINGVVSQLVEKVEATENGG